MSLKQHCAAPLLQQKGRQVVAFDLYNPTSLSLSTKKISDMTVNVSIPLFVQ